MGQSTDDLMMAASPVARRVAKSLARRHRLAPFMEEELEAAAMKGALDSVKRWKGECPFPQFAWPRMVGEAVRWMIASSPWSERAVREASVGGRALAIRVPMIDVAGREGEFREEPSLARWLRPEEEQLLRRRFVDEEKVKDIAEEMGVSASAVSHRIKVLLARLRESGADVREVLG